MHLPPTLDLSLLGLDDPTQINIEELHRKHGNALFRVWYGQRQFVLKWFGDPMSAHEIHAYALLTAYGVPTLPVYGSTSNALLLEDLSVSDKWRLADEEDVKREEIGAAVAEWYRALHAAGRQLLSSDADVPAFLTREVDALNAESIMATASKLGMADHPNWRLAVAHIDALVCTFRAFPETLNYNDFHWTNLAVSRSAPAQAIVFDYHLLDIGPVYCDIRNIVGSLGERARAAFLETYGPVDERVAIFDVPLSVLYSLYIAANQPHLPAWAQGCLQHVTSDEYHASLQKAIITL